MELSEMSLVNVRTYALQKPIRYSVISERVRRTLSLSLLYTEPFPSRVGNKMTIDCYILGSC